MDRYRTIQDFLSRFPNRTKNTLSILGFVKYKDIQYIDEKGDILYESPHFYFEKSPNDRLFSFFIYVMGSGHNSTDVKNEGYTRVKVFPDKFPVETKGKFHESKEIVVTSEFMEAVDSYSISSLFGTTDKYNYLKYNDTVTIVCSKTGAKKVVQFKVKYQQIFSGFLATNSDYYRNVKLIKQQIGEEITADDLIYVYEFRQN